MARKAAGRDDGEAALSEDDLAGSSVHAMEKKKSAKSRGIATATATAGTKRKAAPKQSRQVLADRTNTQGLTDSATIDDDDLEKPKSKRAKTTEPMRKPVNQQKEVARPRETVAYIPETQPSPPAIEEIEQTFETARMPPQIASSKPAYQQSRARTAPVRERSTSASGTERDRRGADPETRRQLTAITRRCESLDLKNQVLEDLVKDKAESNFDKLKREADHKTKQADELIAAVKKEISVLRQALAVSSTETESLKKQLAQVRQENAQLDQEFAAAKQRLQTGENDKKALEIKLVAARQQLASDAADAKSSNGRVTAGSKSTEAQRDAKMKESLYTDLTGLIIRGVKRKEGEDEFDCIQTGRNGTLHFHLSVMNETSTSHPKTPGLSYEDAEFSYEPFLDESRDKDLLEILPDYLSEDICFPRNHAIKFYSKVVESMTRKIVLEEEEEEDV